MTSADGHVGGRHTPSSLTLSLPPRDLRVIQDVGRFRQLSAWQIGELHFSAVRSATPLDRTLKRLTTSKHLVRLERPRGGVGGGSAQLVYQLGRVGWKLLGKTGDYWVPKSVNLHTLAVGNWFVQLNQASRSGAFEVLDFLTESAAHKKVGTIQLTPDALMTLGFGQRGSGETLSYWVEVDRGTERAEVIQEKCVRYWNAYDTAWPPDEVFPLILFVVPDDRRKQEIERVIKGGPDAAQGLFEVCLMTEIPAF